MKFQFSLLLTGLILSSTIYSMEDRAWDKKQEKKYIKENLEHAQAILRSAKNPMEKLQDLNDLAKRVKEQTGPISSPKPKQYLLGELYGLIDNAERLATGSNSHALAATTAAGAPVVVAGPSQFLQRRLEFVAATTEERNDNPLLYRRPGRLLLVPPSPLGSSESESDHSDQDMK